MFSKNALYRPPASPLSMVLDRLPSTAICSAKSMPEAVAIAPASLKPSFICSPLVLNSWTARAVWPPSFSTHWLLPMASACCFCRLYNVPTYSLITAVSDLVALASTLLVLVKVASWEPARPLMAPSILYAEETNDAAFSP